jgi:hypothetical protein
MDKGLATLAVALELKRRFGNSFALAYLEENLISIEVALELLSDPCSSGERILVMTSPPFYLRKG